MRLSFLLLLLIPLTLTCCGGSQDEPAILPIGGMPGADSYTDNLFVEGFVLVPSEEYMKSVSLTLKEVEPSSEGLAEHVLQMEELPVEPDGHFSGSMRLSRGYARLVAGDRSGVCLPDSLDLVPAGYQPGVNWNMMTFKASFRSVLRLELP